MGDGSIIISKEHRVAKRKDRDKESPAQYTKNKRTKDEEKLFPWAIWIFKNSSILWITYMMSSILSHWA